MESKIAVFIDFENIAIGAEKAQLGPFKISVIIEKLKLKGDIIVKKAYADWLRYAKYKYILHENGIDLIDLPANNAISGKNSCDIKMVIDAIELAFTKPYIDTFALITGDSDFSFLALKLKEHDKRVIGVGVESSTHPQLTRCCDEFIFYDHLIHLPTTEDYEHMDVFTLLKEAIYSLQKENKEVIYGSMIKETILKKLPSFDEQNYGFSLFKKLLLDAQAKGIINLKQAPDKPDFEVELVEEDPSDPKSNKNDPNMVFELIVKAILNQKMDKYVMHPANIIREEILKKTPSFNERKYGFKSFRHLLECAQAKGFVRLEKDTNSNSFYIVGIADNYEAKIKEAEQKHKVKENVKQETKSINYTGFLKNQGITTLPPEHRKKIIFAIYEMYKNDLKNGATFKTLIKKLEEHFKGSEKFTKTDIYSIILSLSQSGCFVGKSGDYSKSISSPLWMKISPYEAMRRVNKFILWNATIVSPSLEEPENLARIIFGSEASLQELEELIKELERDRLLIREYKDDKEIFQRTKETFL